MKTLAAKTLVLLVAFSLVGGTFLPLANITPRAHAQGANAAYEVNPAVVGGITAIAASAATSATAEVEQSLFSKILNGIAWRVAKAAIQAATRSLVVWINSGFEGSPAFVTNLNRELRNLGDAVARDFFTELSARGGFDSPFMNRVVTGVGAAYYLYSSEERLEKRLRYTLREYVRDDRAFLGGDFEAGGFNGWFSAWLHQANNPIGAHYVAGTELAAGIEAKQFARLQDLLYGNGFRSWNGDCIQYDRESLSEEEQCVKYETKTPGSVIESQLENVLGSPIDQLELADSINEVVDALYSQLVTQVIMGSGLIGSTRPSSGGGRSTIDNATNPYRVTGDGQSGVGQAFLTTLETAQRDAGTYHSSWVRIRDAANEAKTAIDASGIRCNPTAQERSLVETALAEGNTAVERGLNAVTKISEILERVRTAINGGGNNTVLDTSSQEYLRLVSANGVPSTDEAKKAKFEASADSSSTYARLISIARACET